MPGPLAASTSTFEFEFEMYFDYMFNNTQIGNHNFKSIVIMKRMEHYTYYKKLIKQWSR